MLKIKLIRFGKRSQPHYRVVVQEARTKRDGKYTALLGHYAPTQQPKTLKIDLDEYKAWMAKGAQPTETVAHLVKRLESGNPFPEKKPKLSKKAKAKLAAADAGQAAEKEANAEETKTEKPEKSPAEEKVEEKKDTTEKKAKQEDKKKETEVKK